MSKQTNKKVCFDDLLASKCARELVKKEGFSIFVPALNGELDFTYPTDQEILQCMELQNQADQKDIINAYTTIIYNNCKLFQSEKTVKEFNVTDPLDVVRMLFSPPEISALGLLFADKISSSGKIKEIKN